MSVYLCVRIADADARGGPLGSAAEPGHFCGQCGREVYTDPASRLIASHTDPPMRLLCTVCFDRLGRDQGSGG